jgi:hypothetical protein
MVTLLIGDSLAAPCPGGVETILTGIELFRNQLLSTTARRRGCS